MKPFKKIFALILVIAVAELVPFGLSKYITDFFGQYISQRTASGYFILALIHRGSQFILALILIKLVFKEKLSLSFFLISSFCLDGFTGYINNLYPLGMGWMLAKLGRDILLLDAFAEEILFRLFVILFFERYWTGRVKYINGPYLMPPYCQCQYLCSPMYQSVYIPLKSSPMIRFNYF